MALTLANGDVGAADNILHTRTDLVMHAWQFRRFQEEYAQTEAALNKKP